MSILRFLGLEDRARRFASEPASEETRTVRKVVEALEHLPEERARFIAAFGYLLGRTANADSHISPEETRAIERIIMEHAQLPEEQAVIVTQTAKTHTQLFGGTEDFLVAREFGNMATREQKLALLDCLYAVAAEEDDVSMVEDKEIRQIASELRLEHRDFIAVRSKWKDRLKLLQDLPEGPGEKQ